MLMVGAAGRNVGKTELACTLLRRFGRDRPIIAVKVTAVDRTDGNCPRGGAGCGVCSSLATDFVITEEKGGAPGKDTSRLLEAGAHRVFWLRVLKSHLEEGFSTLREQLDPRVLLVCESTSLRTRVEPDLFILARDANTTEIKPSARGVIEHTDRVLSFDGRGFDFDVGRIGLVDDRWVIREPATALVLAGGRSRRMGRDKSLLPVAGKPMIEHIVDRLRPHFDELLVSADEEDKFRFLGVPVVVDRVANRGPLQGLASGLEVSTNALNFVVACDMPGVNLRLVRQLLSRAPSFDGVVPMTGEEQYEPLFAVYRRSILPTANRLLEDGHRRIRSLFDFHRFNFVRLAAVQATAMRNLNIKGEYEEFCREVES